MTDIIFHHYQNSPFSEKLRLIFGFKKLAWKSVAIPPIMPKPDLTALTGGYRRTPVMQIGADIYCDTALIADVLERLAPNPTLYPQANAGLSRALAQWADTTLFWAAIGYSFQPAGAQNVFAGMLPEQVQGFAADRAKFRANVPRLSPLDASGQLIEMLARLAGTLADGRPYLLGSEASIADFSTYHGIWFVCDVARLSGALDGTPKLAAWAGRMAEFGHGSPIDLSSAEALAIAREGESEDLSMRPFIDYHGVKLGERVTIAPTDYGIDPVEGELVLADANEYAVRRQDERAGTVTVHFPRLGFQLKKAE